MSPTPTPSPPQSPQSPTDGLSIQAWHYEEDPKRPLLFPITQLSRDDLSPGPPPTQLYSAQEMLNMIRMQNTCALIQAILPICSHLPSRLLHSLCLSYVSHTIQHDEKAPDTAVLATPAAHMRHHGGCDTTEDNKRLKRRWGVDQNEPGLLPPLLRTGVIQARKKGC